MRLSLRLPSAVFRPSSCSNQRGVALILVVSMLAVVGIMATSFAFWMRLEQRAALNFLETVRMRHLAEAGVAHARAVLREDRWTNSYDAYDEAWGTVFAGADADLDGDQTPDSRWISSPMSDPDGVMSWRYAVLIRDEAGKINMNSAGLHHDDVLGVVQGWTPYEVGLEPFLQTLNDVSEPTVLAGIMMGLRLGPDGKPGEAGVDDDGDQALLGADGIDNDADGEIDEAQEGVDEPDEFSVVWPRGDDRPWLTVDEVRGVLAIDDDAFDSVRRHLTVHSQDISLYPELEGERIRWVRRWNLNTSGADEVLAALVAAGVADPWQLAANLTDWVDSDMAQSLVAKKVLPVAVSSAQVDSGGWEQSLIDATYDNHHPGSAPGTWTWSNLPVGTYRAIMYSNNTRPVGVVTIQGSSSSLLDDASFFPSYVMIEDDLPTDGLGPLSVTVSNPSDSSVSCRFASMDLIPISGGVGIPVSFLRGVETVRINELMVSPQKTVETVSTQTPGGDWAWQGNGFQNAVPEGGAEGSGRFTWSGLTDGDYYIWLHNETGDPVGDVTINGVMQTGVSDGERFTAMETVSVSGGFLAIDIQNNLSNGSCMFRRAVLSQEPDAEWLELMNLGDQPVDIGGWQVQGPGSQGWPARVPLGTRIGPKDYVVLAVDAADTGKGLAGNGISFAGRWGGGTKVVQLDFDKSVTPGVELFRDSPHPGDVVALRDGSGNVVDVVEYLPSQVVEFRSLEKADPTAVVDVNGNSVEDKWYLCSVEATPGQPNQNEGLLEIVGEEEILHTQDEVWVKSGPLASIGQAGVISTGKAWETCSPKQVGLLSEAATVFGVRLELEAAASVTGSWKEENRAPPMTPWFVSSAAGQEGAWEWGREHGLLNGGYTLRLGGKQGERIQVSIQRADGSWTPFSPALEPGPNGLATYGAIGIGTGGPDSTASKRLAVRVLNSSLTGSAHLDYVQLDPQLVQIGRLNVNTASAEALQALPGVTADVAASIVSRRPYAHIGEVLLSEALGALGKRGTIAARRKQEASVEEAFARIANLITVRSNTFEVIAVAQALRGGRVVAQHRVRTVIER